MQKIKLLWDFESSSLWINLKTLICSCMYPLATIIWTSSITLIFSSLIRLFFVALGVYWVGSGFDKIQLLKIHYWWSQVIKLISSFNAGNFCGQEKKISLTRVIRAKCLLQWQHEDRRVQRLFKRFESFTVKSLPPL